jgi:hypothetical protein
MLNSQLKKLIESEVRLALQENIQEPSEQILKACMAYFKTQTGINAGLPALAGRSQGDALYYVVSLDKEIKTPVLKALFRSLDIRIMVTELRDQIGGYAFQFGFDYKHPQGGSNGLTLGTILFMNNKFSSRGF